MKKTEFYLLIVMMLAALALVSSFRMGTAPNVIGLILIVSGQLRILSIKKKEKRP